MSASDRAGAHRRSPSSTRPTTAPLTRMDQRILRPIDDIHQPLYRKDGNRRPEFDAVAGPER